jgi:pantoate--beta-alanine ligase
MGALHEGHGMLLRRARKENKTVAVTIFVNPAQFGPQEDLGKYPRDLEGDLRLLRMEEADLVFLPTVAEIYPPGFDTWVDAGALADLLEGAMRPGHFRGVATVVTKLLNLTRPDRAYFGQKDGQQVTIIRKLARELCLGTDIIAVPTVREPDGLAFSSRNAFLNSPQRKAAPVVYRALCRAQGLWQKGDRDAESLRREVRAVLDGEPLIDSIDYVSVAAAESLEELKTVKGRVMVSVAVRLGATRLIDNIILE